MWGVLGCFADDMSKGIDFFAVKLAFSSLDHKELRQEATVYTHLSQVGPTLSDRVRIPRYFGLSQEDVQTGTTPMLALVLSFEPGDAVREALDDRDRLDVRSRSQAAFLTLVRRTDLQTAVKQLYARGVCHGDLAPRNALRMQDGTYLDQLSTSGEARALITDGDYDQRHDLSALDTEFP